MTRENWEDPLKERQRLTYAAAFFIGIHSLLYPIIQEPSLILRYTHIHKKSWVEFIDNAILWWNETRGSIYNNNNVCQSFMLHMVLWLWLVATPNDGPKNIIIIIILIYVQSMAMCIQSEEYEGFNVSSTNWT